MASDVFAFLSGCGLGANLHRDPLGITSVDTGALGRSAVGLGGNVPNMTPRSLARVRSNRSRARDADCSRARVCTIFVALAVTLEGEK